MAGKPRGKGKNPSGPNYSSTNYRIPVKYERLLRFAGLYLEAKGESVHTPQHMVEDAVTKYIALLSKKYSITFPDYLLGDESTTGTQDPS